MGQEAEAGLETDVNSQQLSWVKHNIDSERLTTFGLGHSIPTLFEPNSITELADTLAQLRSEDSSWRVIGAGSNVLLPASELNYPLIRLGNAFNQSFLCENHTYSLDELNVLQSGESVDGIEKLSEISAQPEGEQSHLLAFAAAPLMSLSRRSVKFGLSGLEFAAGIPGTVGGGIAMNAGAHGAEISGCVERVYFLDSRRQLLIRESDELCFAYRHSKIPPDAVILAAHFLLRHDEPKKVAAERTRCLEYRKQTQPLHLPSAGSVFRNPEDGPAAAQMLEEVGIKGLERGGVAFSSMHANWLVRHSSSGSRVEDAKHARELIEVARMRVQERFGIHLVPEIQRW